MLYHTAVYHLRHRPAHRDELIELVRRVWSWITFPAKSSIILPTVIREGNPWGFMMVSDPKLTM